MGLVAARVGIAGFGLAGMVFHAPLIAAVDGLELVRVQTTNAERVARARELHPRAEVVRSPEELMDGIDLLVVAAVNSAHARLALAGRERGLGVVVDKPLAVTAEDARRVVDAGGRLTVFQNRRWDEDFLTV